jgi:hypothetical protein
MRSRTLHSVMPSVAAAASSTPHGVGVLSTSATHGLLCWGSRRSASSHAWSLAAAGGCASEAHTRLAAGRGRVEVPPGVGYNARTISSGVRTHGLMVETAATVALRVVWGRSPGVRQWPRGGGCAVAACCVPARRAAWRIGTPLPPTLITNTSLVRWTSWGVTQQFSAFDLQPHMLHPNHRGSPKRRHQVWTVLHNVDCRASNGTTPASQGFRRALPDLFETVVSHIEALPRPRRRNQALVLSDWYNKVSRLKWIYLCYLTAGAR